MKKLFKQSLAMILAVVMLFGSMPLSEQNLIKSNIIQTADAANAVSKKYKGICLGEIECVGENHHTGNLGDSRIYKLDETPFTGYAPYGDNGTELSRNGNVGVNGQHYSDGFEAWIA